jgi:hypothetical protein
MLVGLAETGRYNGLGAVTTLGDGEYTNTRRRGVAGGSWGTEAEGWVDEAAGGGDVQVGARGVAGESTLGGCNGGWPWGTGSDEADKEGPISRHF